MIAFAWLLVGAALALGHWMVSALPYIGGACIVLAVILLGALALHAATWAIRREREIGQTAAAGPDDTAPLTAYDLAVLDALAGNTTDQTNRSSQ